ncbi:cupin [Candidatus Parcubacteria bacterium]|nr:MAG: cupin [Candidatus Parcubacteria bacterium]
MIYLNKIDKSKFINHSYVKKIDKPWGYELHWVSEDKPYMGKLLHIDAGKRLSLQIHDQKEETWFLVNGRGKVIWDDDQGNLTETELEKEKGYSCQIGQRHRLAGITDCDIIEVSTPEMGTTLRLEDDYKRPDETPKQRKIERGKKI